MAALDRLGNNLLHLPTAEERAKKNDRFRLEIFGPSYGDLKGRVLLTKTVELMFREYAGFYADVYQAIQYADEFDETRTRSRGKVRVGMHQFRWRIFYLKCPQTLKRLGRIYIGHVSETV
jgi:hypothetical protein